MANVETQNAVPRSVTQAVYTVAFENFEVSREIAEQQAEKRRVEAVEREKALKSKKPPVEDTPSVIVDVKSLAVANSIAPPLVQPSAGPQVVDLLA